VQGVGEDGYAVGENTPRNFDEGKQQVEEERHLDVAHGSVCVRMPVTMMRMVMVVVVMVVTGVAVAVRHALFSLRKVNICAPV
jgi:hypothetical protein